MAERRMFAKSIVLSDAFLDMPLSARCLYFTLGMLADDDGFISNPKAIMRQCGASQDDMAVLLQKRYLLSFDSGVIVIKHWRMNNYLQSDRCKKTTYLEERSMLEIDARGAYTEKDKNMYTDTMYTQCMYTQSSVVESSVDKGSVVEDTNQDAHTQQISYESLCKQYGKAFVDERMERAKKYKNINIEKIATWCAEDAANKKKSTKKAAERMETQDYDFEKLEKAGRKDNG